MMKICGHIYETTDYEMFKRLPENRDVLGGRINKLVASMSYKYIMNPIIVNEKMEIIDGQGRFEAAKFLGLPIYYIIVPSLSNDDCRRLNHYNTKWSALDYAKGHARGGKAQYIRLLRACEITGYPISRILRFVNQSGKNSLAHDDAGELNAFERGDLSFTEEDYEMVKLMKTYCEDIIDALQFTGRPNDAFFVGVKIISEAPKYDHNKMLKNCKLCRSTYGQMSRLSDQLKEFERIYNYNAKAKTSKIYFSDYMRTRGASTRDYTKTRTPYKEKDLSTLKEG